MKNYWKWIIGIGAVLMILGASEIRDDREQIRQLEFQHARDSLVIDSLESTHRDDQAEISWYDQRWTEDNSDHTKKD